MLVLVLAILWGLWEGYRWLWIREGWTWPFVVDDITMPPLQNIFGALFDPAHDLDTGHHIQRPVEPAAVRDGVDVPADQQRAFRVARQREPLVAGGVDRLLGAGSVELSAEPFAGALPCIGPGDALGAVFVAGHLLKLS